MEPTDTRQKARAVYHHTQGRALGSTFLETESLRQFFLTDIEDESENTLIGNCGQGVI